MLQSSLRQLLIVMADFASVGHFWWALFLGCLGGHFARFVYLRRVKEQKTELK
jgi:hypothetical protein